MNRVFLDTSFFKAFIDEKDEFHQQALKVLKDLEEKKTILITSNYILDETITLIRAKCGMERVKNFQEALTKVTLLKIFRISVEDEENAWPWFWREWSKLSFTDCVSFVLMQRLEIKEVASFDEHFSKAGFKVLK